MAYREMTKQEIKAYQDEYDMKLDKHYCSVCGRELIWLVKKNAKPITSCCGETTYSVSYKYIDPAEYKRRRKDGRISCKQGVCYDCVERLMGRAPKSLQELNEERKQKDKESR